MTQQQRSLIVVGQEATSEDKILNLNSQLKYAKHFS